MQKLFHKGQVHLCLFAVRPIPANTELRYDYGVSGLPWRKKGKSLDNATGGIEAEQSAHLSPLANNRLR